MLLIAGGRGGNHSPLCGATGTATGGGVWAVMCRGYRYVLSLVFRPRCHKALATLPGALGLSSTSARHTAAKSARRKSSSALHGIATHPHTRSPTLAMGCAESTLGCATPLDCRDLEFWEYDEPIYDGNGLRRRPTRAELEQRDAERWEEWLELTHRLGTSSCRLYTRRTEEASRRSVQAQGRRHQLEDRGGKPETIRVTEPVIRSVAAALGIAYGD